MMQKGPKTANREHVIRLLGGSLFDIDLGDPEETEQRAFKDTTLEKLTFQASHGQKIRAYFLHPTKQNAPAILYCHAHGARYDIGIEELTDGRPALSQPYLGDLAAAGFAVLCLEMPTFGTRSEPKEEALSKALHWHGKTLFGQMLAELIGGVSYLAKHPMVDPKRIGTIGISMGGTHAWWLAALDPRLNAAVSMCCFADLGTLIETGAHDGHGPYMTVPGLLAHCSTGQLASLTAPRPQLHCMGLEDAFTPQNAILKAQDELQKCYAQTPEKLEFYIENETGHQETQKMRQKVLAFLKNHLIQSEF